MSELNWQNLRMDMLRNGVAPKYVRRTILELSSHFAELKSQALREGLSELEASRRAQGEIGDDATILKEVLSKPELRSWQSRFPRLFFLIAPSLTLITSFALVVASLLYFAYSASWLGDMESGADIAAWRKGVINGWFMLNCYLVAPLLALATVAMAKERLIEPLWPAFGILLLALLGCGWAYSIAWPTAETAGSFSLNWGYSFFPRAVRGDHDIQNYLKILATLSAAGLFWRLYDPMSKHPIHPTRG